MPRKTTSKKDDQKANEDPKGKEDAKGKQGEEDQPKRGRVPAPPMVTVLKTGQAEKLSPRSAGSFVTYQVGRRRDKILVRITGNDSSGRFSKEWVGVDAIRAAMEGLPKDVESFKGALALRSAWKGRSSCNPGFGAAILKAEGVFVADGDPKKKGMLKLASEGALSAWEEELLALEVPEDAEKVRLFPKKPVPPFAKKEGEETPGGDGDAEVKGEES